MITLTGKIPPVEKANAEWIKQRCTFECYPQDGLFWEQDGGRAYISMTDGNAVIRSNGADFAELREFTDFINPCCVFSDIETLRAVGRMPDEPVSVMGRAAATGSPEQGDLLRSDELYDLLNVSGLSLPEYEYFAVDICRRLNRGLADYFAIRGKCAAISLNTGDYAIMNGIASRERGFGSRALNAVMKKNAGRYFVVCCRPAVRGFYEKNGFDFLYEAGYWVKNK